MARLFESWGQTVKDLVSRVFGPKEVGFKDVLPGDSGWLQSVWPGLTNVVEGSPKPVPSVSGPGNVYGRRQRLQKLSRKGPRQKRRSRK